MDLSHPREESLADTFGAADFHARHIGPSPEAEARMLERIGCKSRAALVDETVPAGIRLDRELAIGEPVDAPQALAELTALAARNECWRSLIGAGYHGTHTPEAIRRNVLENPGWYTAYTPYQAEISQGRLEMLLNFQQMAIDLTGLPLANASLLDEATAAAEGMAVCRRASKSKAATFFVESGVHPQVLAVIRTRARWMDIALEVGDIDSVDPAAIFGAYLQNPDTEGRIRDLAEPIARLRSAGARVCVGVDPLAQVLMRSPGAMGADLAVGSAQRFGVPLGFGGPHAAFMAGTKEMQRLLPGRIIGVSRDAAGATAYRMALQTREQHIRRDKATSNICTAQALLANMAAMYAIWHGPAGLARIARRVHGLAKLLAALCAPVRAPRHADFFDTLVFEAGDDADAIRRRAAELRINLRDFAREGGPAGRFGVAIDETTRIADIADLAFVLTGERIDAERVAGRAAAMPASAALPGGLTREDAILTHPVFNRYHSETEFMRYLKRLENRDISLVHSMIPLGSCTMKLNAAAEMAPLSWPAFAQIHPMAPVSQTAGYREMIDGLGQWLAEITGFHTVSFQPNSGAQGEYAGLLAIRAWHAAQGHGARDVCLIPASAHGTNPASASMMGLRVVVVACDTEGSIDMKDLRAKIDAHRDALAALMVTYPSTHGVFEEGIREACEWVHEAGGQVYMDGANLNAMAGIARPGDIGADVCHMNLHKTFCIPHGGGGPGMGPIGVAAHLAPHLPGDPFAGGVDAVSAAPFGSASILTISWMYLRMMGGRGIRLASEYAILNANYVAARLAPHFPVLYRGANGRVAHECILDMRDLKARFGVTAEDVAKRLMDYGFHAPTLSFPVADTLMIEPTESESKEELDRFCDAMIAIAGEIAAIGRGELDREDNPLRQAPHTATEIVGQWQHPYSREQAAYPLPWIREAKFWPSVKRIDNAAGDRQLVCTCPPMEAWLETEA
ncbi:MAG: aminomethyl-transferring glycine dehydrogenase [Burkholderiaceae bacterium]|nr:aminomethyl-transferring glycine dehydrogenase [Burkholderiaceae bacterium]MEB2319697.1 aminomethyl-transferring glycine dehydrogenase [Pseudomonadota bacterium]